MFKTPDGAWERPFQLASEKEQIDRDWELTPLSWNTRCACSSREGVNQRPCPSGWGSLPS